MIEPEAEIRAKRIAARRKAFAAALRTVLEARQIPAKGGAAAAILKTRGRWVNPYRIDRWLKEEATVRQASIGQLVEGLDLTATERALLQTAASGRKRSSLSTVVLRDAFSREQINRGRTNEAVHWSYVVGNEPEGDRVLEERLTPVGDEPFQFAGVAIGQLLGQPAFDILDLAAIDLRIEAKLESAPNVPIGVSASVLEYDVVSHQHRLGITFSKPIRNDVVRWRIRFRWPDMWDSVRSHGHGSGQLGTAGASSAKVTMKADTTRFPNFDLIRLEPVEAGTVSRRVEGGYLVASWTVKHPPPVLGFRVVTTAT